MSKDKFILSAGQSHELELALNRPGNGAWTSDLVHRLTQGNVLGQVRQVLLGNGSIVINRTIDCNTFPSQPNNVWVLKHQKGGLFEWNKDAAELWLSEEQWNDQVDDIEPVRVWSDLKAAQLVPMNANVLDFLLENQDLIPDSWKGLHVYFWGTIYHDNTREKNEVVRYLHWLEKRGDIGGSWCRRYVAQKPTALDLTASKRVVCCREKVLLEFLCPRLNSAGILFYKILKKAILRPMWNAGLKDRLIALVVLLIGAGFGYLSYSDNFLGYQVPFKLGLDLAGGTHLVYRADTANVAEGEIEDSMNALRDVIERRVNLFGVSEPLVQVEGGFLNNEQRLVVELPGVTDIDEAVEQIGKTPLLEFKLVRMPESLSSENVTETGELVIDQTLEDTGLTGRFVQRASLQFDQSQGQFSNTPLIVLQFNSEGAALFEKITKENVGTALAIVLDGNVISAPTIQEAIPGGTATITGQFTPEEARALVRDLNFGALPLEIELVSTQTIGASLGGDSLERGVMAGVYGFILVALFMIFWYRLPGLVSVIALLMYGAILLALFKLIPVTLTAAGIAGFILSLGMAVDANILIFERMKEELAGGHGLYEALHQGFARAWTSIRDSNISSIITAVILYWMGGTAIIQGFALVFGLGVLVSMLTAISVSRTLLYALPFVHTQHTGLTRFLFGNGLQK